MTTETSAPAVDSSPAPANDTPRGLSDMLAEARQAPESAEIATEPEPDSAPEAESAAPVEDPGNKTEEAEPADLPPIEPPRSWTQAEKERFQSLPRETQEYLHTREQEREKDFRTRQNEVAEQRKAVQAEREAAEKARQQLEADVKAARDVIEREQRTKFPDIKSWDDYERLSAEASRIAETDPFTSLKIANYLKDFDTHQRSVQYNAQQVKQLEDQKAQERLGKRNAYEAEQNKLLLDLVPEMADPKKAADLRERAVAMLNNDLGLQNDLLGRWMSDDTGHEILSNAGIQKLMADGLKYRDIQSAKITAAAKPVPAVQKPGTSKPSGLAQSENITRLSAKLETGDHRDLGALLGAMRRA